MYSIVLLVHDDHRKCQPEAARFPPVGPSSERKAESEISKGPVLLSLLPPPPDPPATKEVLLPEATQESPTPRRMPRQPAVAHFETVKEQIEPEETIRPHSG